MLNSPENEQESQQDVLEDVSALLSNIDLELMEPGKREQVTTHDLTVLLCLLKLRQEFAQEKPSMFKRALLDAIVLRVIKEG